MTDQDNLRDKIARVLYIESSEAEDGDVVWASPEAIAEEVESWGRFAQAIIDELGLTVEDRLTEYGIDDPGYEYRIVGEWEAEE